MFIIGKNNYLDQNDIFINMKTSIRTMKQLMVTIPKEEYKKLKIKEGIIDAALIQLKLSLEDLRHGRISRFDL